MTAMYVLKQSEEGRFSFTLQTHGGELLLTSPDFPDKVTALSRLNSTRQLAGTNKNYELLTAEDGGMYFLLRNARKEVIGQSILFPDSASRLKGINLLKTIARVGKIEDQTGKG